MFKTAEEYKRETDEWVKTLPDRYFNIDTHYIEQGIRDKSSRGLYNLLIPIKNLNSKHIPSNIDRIREDLINRGFEVSDYIINVNDYNETKCILITWNKNDRTYIKTISDHIKDILINDDDCG